MANDAPAEKSGSAKHRYEHAIALTTLLYPNPPDRTQVARAKEGTAATSQRPQRRHLKTLRSPRPAAHHRAG
jgi:hypothetical protein